MRVLEADIDMTSGGYFPTLHMNQGDTDFGIMLRLYNSVGDFSIGTGATARVHGTKPDGTAFDSAALITGESVVLAGTAALTGAAGTGAFEVRLEKDGEYLHSQNFRIHFEKNPAQED